MIVKTETLERLRQSLNQPVNSWAEMLHLSERQYRAELNLPEFAIADPILELVSEELELTSEAIASGNVDFRLLARRYEGDAMCMPEKYALAAHSKVRTSSHVLDFVEINQGWRERNRILRHFQLNESIFSNLNTNISIRFFADLWLYLQARGVTLNAFYEIGKFSVVSNINSPVAVHFKRMPDAKTAYESLFTEIIGLYYDQNFIYSLQQLRSTGCVVEARPNPLVLDELRAPRVGNKGTCTARGGAFASILGFMDLPDAEVVETKCIHRGDPFCRYFIRFEDLRSSDFSQRANC